MPWISVFDRNFSNSSSFRKSKNHQNQEQQSNIMSYPKVNNTAAKENGCDSSFVKQYHASHASDRTLIDFSNNHNDTTSMSAATAARSSFHPHAVAEESYCAPWDLKTQEEKLKILSEQRSTPASSTSSSTNVTSLTDALLHPSNTNQRSISSSSIQNPFHRTRSARTTSFNKKSSLPREPSPPLLPPLPPGGLVPTTSTNIPCQCSSNTSTRTRTVQNQSSSDILDPSLKKISYCLNAHAVRSATDTSRSFVFASSSPLNERSQKVNTAPAKVELSSLGENRSDSSHITSQSSTVSLLSTTSSSSIESPMITDDTKPMSFEAALQRFKRLSSSTRSTINNHNNNHNNNNNNEISSSSLPKPKIINPSQETPIAYERPWDTLQASLINSLSSLPQSAPNHSRDSLQKVSSTDESKLTCPPPFPMLTLSPNSCRHTNGSPDDKLTTRNTNTGEFNKMNNARTLVPVSTDNDTTIPIDRYFWYHYAMSRRRAETILQARPPGSFLVRQSESGNQNDYSLSIRTAKSCMHMRICQSSGVYILGECSRPFASVSRMIEYFSQTSVPVRGTTPIKLGTPVFRCETLQLSSPTNHHLNDSNDELL